MPVVNRSRGRRRRKRRGASAAELALILPILVTIVLGCVDFGRFAYNNIAVTNSARAGAASAMMNNYSSSTQGTWVANVTTAAQQEMTGQMGYNSSNLTVVSPALSGSSVTGVTVESTGLRRVTVTVTYPFHTVVNWNFGIFSIPQNLTLRKTIVVRTIR
jgi:Flp pilus assembly protein TadG